MTPRHSCILGLGLRLRAAAALAVGLFSGFAPAAESPPDLALVPRLADPFPGAEAVEGAGHAFRFAMGSKRVNWTHARWSRSRFTETQDWSAFRGLRLRVSAAEPRSDVGVAIALREADGSWHYFDWASDLVVDSGERELLFTDFRPALWVAPHVLGMPADHLDENQIFDPDAVDQIAIGVVNSLGVGDVDFTVEELALLPPPTAAVPAAVTITVSGQTLDIKGTEMVPAGLFGHFPGGGSREMRMGSHREIHNSYLSEGGTKAPAMARDPAIAVLIDVMGGDRYSSSGRLTDRRWQENYRQRGLQVGRNLARYQELYDREMVIEWWNEPYLNWSNRTRRNFKPEFFDESRAVEGGPVHLSVDGTVAPFLRWTRDPDAPPWLWMPRDQWRVGRDARGRLHRGADFAPPADLADGETYTRPTFTQQRDPESGQRVRVQSGEIELTAYTPWYVYDETQFTFWSGRGQLQNYNEPMLAFGRGLLAANPKAKYLVGWDFRVSEDHWAAWDMLYKPTIDAGIELIHGVTDHDYGGDVTRMPANYEFVTAYGMTRYDRWLYNYNTECGENSDPSAYPDASKSQNQANKKWLKARWAARKLVHALATVPDKARSFTWHWFETDAEGVTFTALRSLRGRLVEVSSGDPEIYAVAAIDGSDPYHPRPDYLSPGYELTIAVFNDLASARDLVIPVTAPSATTFTGLVLHRLEADAEAGSMRLLDEAIAVSGDDFTWSGRLEAQELLVLRFTLSDPPVDRAELLRRQAFAPALLQVVTPTAPLETSIELPESALAGATAARLRLVVERLAEGEGTVVINGTPFVLPRANTPTDAVWIRDLAVDPALLGAKNTLRFSAAAGHAGWRLATASLIIDSPSSP